MRKFSQEQKAVWQNHFNAQRQSGLSQQAYSKQQSLKPHRFWYWKNKLEGNTKTYKKPQPQSKPARHSGFVPVNAVTGDRRNRSMVITSIGIKSTLFVYHFRDSAVNVH